MLQTLVAEKSVEGGVDVVVTGDCLRRDLVGKSALQIAAQKGHDQCVKYLLGSRATLNKDIVFESLMGKSETVVKLVLDAKACVSLKDPETGDFALHTCIAKKFWAAIPLLLQHGASVNQADAGGDGPLLHAIRKGPIKASGAASNGDVLRACQTLLGAKALVDARTAVAAWTCKEDGVTDAVLPNKAAAVRFKDADSCTPLHICARTKDYGVVTEIMSILDEHESIKSSVVNARTKTGTTPLMLAAKHGSNRITKMMVQAGADVHMTDNEGNTPLHYTYWEDPETAGIFHNTKIFLALVKYCGANPETKNNKGEKPKDCEEAAHELEMESELAGSCAQQ